MNFLKISGLIVGTGSVVGGTGAGIYYIKIKNNEKEKIEKKDDLELNKKIEFLGKLVFVKKTNNDNSSVYTVEVFTEPEYKSKSEKFNLDKQDGKKYENINKIISISSLLAFENAQSKLKEIFGSETTLQNAKTQILSEKSSELKELFGEKIYTELKEIN